MSDKLTPQEQQVLRKTLARANEQGWGIALGLLGGVGLFAATAVLVLKGGPNPGPHLALLSVYFPGYRVTWLGAVIGFDCVLEEAIERHTHAILNGAVRAIIPGSADARPLLHWQSAYRRLAE